MIDIVVRYLHYIAVFVLIGAVVIENMAIKASISGEDGRNLAKVDAVAGVSALLIGLLGLSLWLWLGKPAAFYSTNPIFNAKLSLFILLVLLAIYPARFFFQLRNSTAESIAVPKTVRVLLRAELVILIIIPILATIMARGIGLSSGTVVHAQQEQQAAITVTTADDLISDFESIVDVVFVYDEAIIGQLPFQQFDWISRRLEEIQRLADSISVVSLTVTAETVSEPVQLPSNRQNLVAVLVFASHEDPVAEAIDISDETNVELRVESWGINVIAN